jgi:hypothetical protein
MKSQARARSVYRSVRNGHLQRNRLPRTVGSVLRMTGQEHEERLT